MIPIEFTISRRTVMAEVMRTTAYIGARKQGDVPQYSHMAVVPEDTEALDRYFTDACEMIADACSEWLGVVDNTSSNIFSPPAGDFSLSLVLPSEYETALSKSISSLMQQYAVESVCSGWMLLLSEADHSTLHATRAVEILNKILGMLYYRRLPQRPIDNEDNE